MLTSYVCRVLLYGSSSIVVESRKKVMSMRLVPFFFPPIPSEKPIVFYAPFAFSAWTTLTTLFPNEPRLHRFEFFWGKNTNHSRSGPECENWKIRVIIFASCNLQ